MTKPRVALATMVVFTLSLITVGVCLFDGLTTAFIANPALNSMILFILVFGISLAFAQMSRLHSAITWLTVFRAKREPSFALPIILTPLSAAFGRDGQINSLGATTFRGMLDGVYTRIDDGRETSRYLMNTLILLGLLGTFWGLLQTVSGIGSVIGGLNVGDGDLTAVFDSFKEGLQTPLVGMGISFSASLFGLASSLILGFFDLTTGRVQTRFCEELEDWLSLTTEALPQTATVTSPLTANIAPARYQEAFIQNLADQLERLQRVFRQQEESREAERSSVRSLSEGVSALDDHLKAQQHVLMKLTDLQQQIAPILIKISEHVGTANQETIEEHTRRIDLNLREIGDKVARSADTVASELREELKIIARILASSEATPNA